MSDVAKIFDDINNKLTADPGKVAGIKAVYLFNVTGEGGGNWYVDLTTDKPTVKTEGSTANCTVTMDAADFISIINGTLNAQMAFMTGKIKIAGDMGLAMKLQKIIG